MHISTPLSREHALFAHRNSDVPWVVRGRAGSGKSLFLTELALSYLASGKKVLHISNTNQQAVKKHYQYHKHDISLQNRLLHTSVEASFLPQNVALIIQNYQELLSFIPDLVIVENVHNIEADWDIFCSKKTALYLSTTLESTVRFPTIELIAVGETIEVHRDDSHGQIYIDLKQRRIYEHTLPKCSSQKTLYASGAAGSEEAFGIEAQKWGIREVHYTFSGHIQNRKRGAIKLNDEELARGSVSLNYVSRKLRRSWNKTPLLKKVLQLIWHIVNCAQQVFVVGTIQEDNSVHGGTGWSVELAQRWKKQVWVFDQEQLTWFFWDGSQWIHDIPMISSSHFAGSGTRFLRPEGKKAIEDLFERSFSPNTP